jgi:hypothetical protein
MDYFSHPLYGYGTDGLPLKEDRSYCETCGAELNEDNKPKYCSGCGIEGCQTCLKECNEAYLCRDKVNKKLYKQKCLDEFYSEFENLLDDVVDKLHKFINNEEVK